MTPGTLAGWSVEAIVEILDKGIFESEDFDFKESLPDPRDEKAKKRLRKACCAFANSNGGFLVFGVADDRTVPSVSRVQGLPQNRDFPTEFGNHTVVELVIADTYPLTASCEPLLKALATLRRIVRSANNKARIFHGVIELPLSNKGEIVRNHNQSMAKLCQNLSHPLISGSFCRGFVRFSGRLSNAGLPWHRSHSSPPRKRGSRTGC
jgi:hypothetical protein